MSFKGQIVGVKKDVRIFIYLVIKEDSRTRVDRLCPPRVTDSPQKPKHGENLIYGRYSPNKKSTESRFPIHPYLFKKKKISSCV